MPAVCPPALRRALGRVTGLLLILTASTTAWVTTSIPHASASESSVLRITGSQTFAYGSRITVSSRLTAGGTELAGRRLGFYDRAAGGTFRWFATATTNSAGLAGVRVSLTRTLQFFTKWNGDAADTGTESTGSTMTVNSLGMQVVREASRHQGAPYSYGAAGPYEFDCSGFTLYVWGRFGRELPHNAAAQYDAADVRHIPAADRAPGDLIFFTSGGSIYHVAIYAGNNEIWAATHSGDHVRLMAIYSSSYVVGRVR